MLNSLAEGALHAIGGYLVYGLMFLLTVVTMKFISKNKQELAYAKIALTVLKDTLGSKLGPKANAIFDIWIDAVTDVSNGQYTKEQMIDEFVKFIVLATQDKFTLNPDELLAIREAAVITINMMNVNSKPTKKAVKAMMSR